MANNYASVCSADTRLKNKADVDFCEYRRQETFRRKLLVIVDGVNEIFTHKKTDCALAGKTKHNIGLLFQLKRSVEMPYYILIKMTFYRHCKH